MDFLAFLTSINKLSLLAFIVVAAVLGYELYLIKKEKGRKETPDIPQFNESIARPPADNKVLLNATPIPTVKKSRLSILIVLVVLTFILGIVTVLGFRQINRVSQISQPALSQPSPILPSIKALPTNEPLANTIPVASVSAGSDITPTPTEAILSYQNVTVTLAPTDELTPTVSVIPTTQNLSPSVTSASVKNLPETGYINNLLVVVSVASVLLVVSFIF